ncbi:MAG: O-antigen ligase family protein [Pseudomonadota bacterium]
MIPTSTLPPDSGGPTYLFRFAAVCAGIALFVAPFRSSAGIRGGMLLLALMAIVAFVWRKSKSGTTDFNIANSQAVAPPPRYLLIALGLWALVVAILSLFGPEPLMSLKSWRGDVLTPMMAGVVFFVLTRTPRMLAAWLLILFISLLALTAMVVMDPFQPFAVGHEPRYVSVGWLSTWLTMLSALLPLTWLVKWPQPKVAQVIGVIALVAILLASWFTASRMVWVCFAAMLIVYGSLQMRSDQHQQRQPIWRGVAVVLVGLVAMAALFYASAAARANLYPGAAPDVAAFMWHDNRAIIWKEALGLITEKPLAGHGYSLEGSREALSSRFTDPWFRDVFKHAHNMLLNVAIQLGFIGALTLLLLFAALSRTFWAAPTRSEFSRAIATCGLILVAGFFLRNMTDDFFSRHAVLLFGALVGMLLAVMRWPASVMSNASGTSGDGGRDGSDGK